jgi:poly(A) polymerase
MTNAQNLRPSKSETPSLGSANWLAKPETQILFDLIEAGGGDLRAVGGCVRDSLYDLSGSLNFNIDFDIDMACDLSPDRMIEIFSAAGLKTIPTGIAHGTITVIVANDQGTKSIYEITTLRKDMVTDGRHAQVEMTDDWTEDARRRDFTINALYADRKGQVYDLLAGEGFSGVSDLAANRVRFIGDPAARISEDYLRILRFFRFHFKLAPSLPLDAAGLAACEVGAQEMTQLSGERICAELLQILSLPSAAMAMRAMHQAGVLKQVLATSSDFSCLERLVHIFERDPLANAADPILRLAACIFSPEASQKLDERIAFGNEISQRLRLSRRSADRLKQVAGAGSKGQMPILDPQVTMDQLRQALFLLGDKSALLDQILLAWAADTRAMPADPTCRVSPTWQKLIDGLKDIELPVFPLTGAMLLEIGFEPGPNMGRAIKTTQDWWRDANFEPDLPALQAYAAALKG